MDNKNVKTLLLVTSSGSDSLFPFLFEFTKYWASMGRQLLYISKTPIQCLPPSLGDVGRPDSNILRLMQFMYLPKWKDLLLQLATIHIRRFQVRAIIIDNLVDYINDEQEDKNQGDHVSHICATLLFAALLSAKRAKEPVALVCGYVSPDSTIEKTIVKNFFHNIWEIRKNTVESNITEFKLLKLSKSVSNEIVSFSYIDDNNLPLDKDRSNVRLTLKEIVRKLIQNYE